jgi:hypothetical protein
MSESLKYDGELDSGIKYQVHSMTSFSGMEEIALIVEGKPVTIITVTRKKNGGIEIKPVLNNKVRIAGQGNPLESQPVEPTVVRPELKED